MEDKRGNILSLMSEKLRDSYIFLREEMNALGLEKLDISHGDILFQLYSKGEMSMKALSESIGKDKSTVTALVKKMTALDLIEKRKDPEDARSQIISLTGKGESLRENFFRISEKLRDNLYSNMSEEDQFQLIELLEKLNG